MDDESGESMEPMVSPLTRSLPKSADFRMKFPVWLGKLQNQNPTVDTVRSTRRPKVSQFCPVCNKL